MDNAEVTLLKGQIAEELERHKNASYPEGAPAIPPIPTARYTSPEFFELEKRYLWSNSWLLAGMASEFPRSGSFKLWEKTGAPVIIIRGKDSVLRAFRNTCRHRGGTLSHCPSGVTLALSCKFHSWVYNLEGQLISVPDEHEFPLLDKEKNSLIALRCEQIGNMVFINFNIDASPLLTSLGPMADELLAFKLDQRVLLKTFTYDMPCNWKIALDAFQEAYHAETVHPETVATVMNARGTSVTLWPNGHSRMLVPFRTDREPPATYRFKKRTGDGGDPLAQISNRSQSIFPNITTSTSEFSFPFLSFWPTSINRTSIEYVFTGAQDADPDSEDNKALFETFRRVASEDLENLTSIQKSIESGAIERFNISYQERKIQHMNEELDLLIGVENIPPRMRVQQIFNVNAVRT